MSRKSNAPKVIDSVSEIHSLMNVRKPAHPLVSVVDLSEVDLESVGRHSSLVYNFYSIYLKRNFDGKIRYGQQYYDFNEGVMTFYGPRQVISVRGGDMTKLEGWLLIVHPDFLQGYPLAAKIKEYGFFSYAVNEALHLSEKEENTIVGAMKNIKEEIEVATDNFTQDVVISHIDLILNYCNRFYNRQFITRQVANKDIVSRLEKILSSYFESQAIKEMGLPSVQYLADQLNISPGYLGDMLRSHTGRSTQQHIHDAVIEKAKELLTTSELSVSEIAFQLGFEYPQSFNKLFRSKTNQSPLEFRHSFN